MADDLVTQLRFVADTGGAEAGIEGLSILMDRLAAKSQATFAQISSDAQKQFADQIVKASQRIADANRQAASGGAAVESANKRVAQSANAAADAALRHEQAFARLLQAQGKSEDAIKTLQRALEGFTGSEIQAVRAQIQLTNLQNDYANSPLIGAVRSQTAALQQFGAANANVEKILKGTAQAGQQVGDSLSDSTAATLAQAQALSQIQALQGDAAGAANTLALGLKAVTDQQKDAVANTEKFTTKIASGLQVGASILNVISAGFNFFSAIQKEAVGGLTEAEAAAKVVTKAFAGSKAAIEAVKNAVTDSVPAVQKLSAEQQAAADKEFSRIGERLAALQAELQRRREIAAAAKESAAGTGKTAGQSAQVKVALAIDGAALLARIREVNAAMVSAGQQAAQGFAAGLRTGSETAKKAGESLGKASEEGVKKSLDIQSPSRVMFKIGSDAVKGFADGFEAGKKGIKPIGATDLTASGLGSLLGRATGQISNLISAQTSKISGAVQQATSSLDNLKAVSLGAAGSAAQLAAAFGPAVVIIGALTVAAVPAARALQSIGEAGIQTNAQLETLRTGLTTVIASVAEIRSSEGVQLKGIDAINASLPVAADQLRKLRIDALETSATIADIAPAFQAAIGPGLVAGLTIDQIRENTIKLTQAVTALGLPLDQIKQETRAILTGDINRNTQAAIALGITKEAVAEAQKQGKFAQFLEEKLSAAAAAGKVVAQTFAAAQSNLQEAGDTFQAVVTEGLFNQLRDKANQILPQIFDKNSATLISKNFEGISETLTRVFDTAGATINKVIDFIFNGLKQISAFLDQNQETVAGIIEAVNQIVVIVGQTIAGLAEIVLGAAGGRAEFESVRDVLKAVVFIVGLISDALKIVISAAFTLGGVIRVAIVAPLELAVTIMARLLDFVPGAGSALKSFSESLTTARQAATAGLAESSKAFASSVKNVGQASTNAMKAIDEAQKGAKANQRAVAGVESKQPGATGATFRPPKRPPEDADAKGAAAKARQEAAAQVKLLQLQEKQAELVNKRVNEGLRVSLQDRLVSLQTYTELAIENDRELLEKRLASLDAEEKAAVRTAKNATEAEAKRAEFALKRATLQQDFDLESERKRDDLRRTQEKAEEDHQRRLVEIGDIGRRALEASIRDAVEQGRIRRTDGERQAIELERQRFADRQAILNAELEAARENVQERQRVQDELNGLAAERAAFEEDASRRIQDAQRKEAAQFTELIRARVAAIAQLRRAELEAAASQAALAVQRGSLSRTDAERQDFDRRVQFIRIESAERQRQIEEESARLIKQARDARAGAAALVEIEKQKNAELKAERDRAKNEQEALRIQQQAAPLVPFFGEDAANRIAATQQLIGAQLTTFEQLRIVMQTTADGLSESMGTIGQVFIQANQAIATSLSSIIASFVAGESSLRQAAAALFSAALKPLKDFLLKKSVAEFALALADLAIFNYPGAAKHALAGTALAAAAGLIDVGGKAIAGGGSAGRAIAGGGSGGFVQEGQFDKPGQRTVEQGGGLPGAPQININLRVRQDRHSIVEVFSQDYQNNGATRDIIRRDTQRD